MSNNMLRPKDVTARTGLSKSTIWRKVRAGEFPKPISLGERAIGWPAEDVDEWIASRKRVSYSADKRPEEAAA